MSCGVRSCSSCLVFILCRVIFVLGLCAITEIVVVVGDESLLLFVFVCIHFIFGAVVSGSVSAVAVVCLQWLRWRSRWLC